MGLTPNEKMKVYKYYNNIFNHYQRLFEQLRPQYNKILKTDCYNEAFDRPIIKDENATLLEYEPKFIEIARKKNPKLNIVQGDIRKLPFEDESFDLILDFSTIDHIPQSDVPKVLSEYNRCLMKGGRLVIITWFNPRGYLDKAWESTNQYFFDYEVFRAYLSDFNFISGEPLFVEFDKCYLYQFILTK